MTGHVRWQEQVRWRKGWLRGGIQQGAGQARAAGGRQGWKGELNRQWQCMSRPNLPFPGPICPLTLLEHSPAKGVGVRRPTGSQGANREVCQNIFIYLSQVLSIGDSAYFSSVAAS